MRIDYLKDGSYRYFDTNGEEINEGDIVILDGKREKVYRTDDGELGTDATNPKWIEREWACPCEFGIYPFCKDDEPTIERG